ncbi:MAG: helix-turn-helix transcriptional regulator [Agathobacter sp.]|nr:helix-turn-helix transcriptional regulator [Agathobacter sp.]
MRIDRIKLTTLLMEKDLTQKKLAELAGISRGTVSYIKCGKSCTDEVGKAIACALQVNVEDILEEKEQTR